MVPFPSCEVVGLGATPYTPSRPARVPVDTTFLPPDSLSRSDDDFLLDVVGRWPGVVGGVVAAPARGLGAPETADIERAAALRLMIRLWNSMVLGGVRALFTLFMFRCPTTGGWYGSSAGSRPSSRAPIPAT